MYKALRAILFMFDAEKVHYFSMGLLAKGIKFAPVRRLIKRMYQTPACPVECFGIKFINPVGLGAGFDKNAIYLEELSLLGFGFIETGTITPLPQQGNDKPRLFRLKQDAALLNRMGFNNDGAEIIAQRLAAHQKNNPGSQVIIGANIGKNKMTANEDAWKDYETCYKVLYNHAHYFVVNVSSPNTSGLRDLQEKTMLKKILVNLQSLNIANKPLLLKIAPDLNDDDLQDITDLALEIKLDGLIIANTTIDRNTLLHSGNEVEELGAGGLSGKPLLKKSNDMLARVSAQTRGKLTLMGSGGIFSGADALEKMKLGASLVQVWTGFIYEGPGLVKKIVNGLKH